MLCFRKKDYLGSAHWLAIGKLVASERAVSVRPAHVSSYLVLKYEYGDRGFRKGIQKAADDITVSICDTHPPPKKRQNIV